MKTSPNFRNISIDDIANWDNHSWCHYCHINGVRCDSTHVVQATGVWSERRHTFGVCEKHALEWLEYTSFQTLTTAVQGASR